MNSYLASKGHVDRARTPAPVESTGTVSNAWAEILGLSSPDTVSVTDDSVRGLPALDRAKNLVVQSVAGMLAAATVVDGDEVLDVPPVVKRPHPLLQTYEFYEAVVDSAIMHGNYVAIILGEGEDAQLVPVPLGMVSVDATSGLPWYTIGDRRYNYREIFHVRAHAPTGTWWGRGVVERFRLGLSEALHSQAYGEASLRTGAVPSMSVKLDVDVPTEDQVNDTKSGLMSKFGGGKREPIVHGRIMDLTPLSWSPHDAEFIESRRITLAEAALMVGLRPEDIGATLGGSLTYGNRSDDAVQRIVDAYTPWLERIEGPLTDLLPRGEVKGNPDALLRLTPEQAEQIESMRLDNEAKRRALAEPAPEPTQEVDA